MPEFLCRDTNKILVNIFQIIGRVHDWGASFVENSIDMAASVVVIVGLIILSLMLTIFIIIQVKILLQITKFPKINLFSRFTVKVYTLCKLPRTSPTPPL
jgi:hypothetical protein